MLVKILIWLNPHFTHISKCGNFTEWISTIDIDMEWVVYEQNAFGKNETRKYANISI